MGKMELKTVLIFFKDAVQSDKKEPKQALHKNIFFPKLSITWWLKYTVLWDLMQGDIYLFLQIGLFLLWL